MQDRIHHIVESQQVRFASGQTKSLEYRIRQLRILERMCLENEEEIVRAVRADLGRDYFDAYMSEVGSIVWEIRYVLRKLRTWARPHAIRIPLSVAPASARFHHEPLGCCLIIGTWNYPIHLVLKPLIGALAAGNCCILKPGELAAKSSALLQKIVPGYFDSSSVAVVAGDASITSWLLDIRFDLIFFTGSRSVASIVMSKAARNLTPVVLELGGSNPCIVTERTKIKTAAKRIVWAALFNTGQTCLAPGFIVTHSSIFERLIDEAIAQIRGFYRDTPEDDPAFGRIVSTGHAKRIELLLEGQDLRWGGKVNVAERYVEPTVVVSREWGNPLIVEEVFGPVLTFLEYSNLNEMFRRIQALERPLAIYLFTQNRSTVRLFNRMSSSGALVINDLVVHAATNTIPLGGVGKSGFGSYRGKAGFETFSHKKPVLRRRLSFDWSIRYPPHRRPGNLLKKILRRFM